MRCTFIVVCLLQLVTAGVCAQTKPAASPLPADLAGLPEAIKSLKWRTIDVTAATPIERGRALLYLNHALDEIGSAAAAQADLMSAFIQAQNLGPACAASPPPADPHPLTYADAMKIALAMLRGPQANSTFNTQLAGATANELAAYESMYQSTCQRRFAEMNEARQQIRLMSAFLKSANKVQDFQAWAPGEIKRRQQAFAQAQAAQQAAEAAQAAADRQSAAAAEKRALEILQAREQKQQIQISNRQMQQALAAAEYQQQQQQAQANAANNSNDNNSTWFPNWYGGETWGVDGAWCQDAGYRGAAAAQTEQRMSGWHGTPRVGGGRR